MHRKTIALLGCLTLALLSVMPAGCKEVRQMIPDEYKKLEGVDQREFAACRNSKLVCEDDCHAGLSNRPNAKSQCLEACETRFFACQLEAKRGSTGGSR